jgi:pyruvyltransferase
VSKEIKLYWWRGVARNTVNLGDEINKHVVEYASGRAVRRAKVRMAEMLAIGSVLHFPQSQNVFAERTLPYLVWGSGSMSAVDIEMREKFVFSAVRGPLTHSLTGYCGGLAYGDPGILSSVIWPAEAGKKHAWGIIPHHSQLGSAWVARTLAATPGAVLIDVTDPDIAATMATIAACNCIAASSLHGLIIADSYQIPNVWLWDGPLHKGGTWKFLDYFAGVQRRLSDFIPTSDATNLNALPWEKMSFNHFAHIDNTAERLLHAFPL